MDAVSDKPALKRSELVLLRRSLLPLDRYAVREGISEGMVEELAKLGIVQIRRFRGRSFVVDVPLSPYSRLADSDEPRLAGGSGESVVCEQPGTTAGGVSRDSAETPEKVALPEMPRVSRADRRRPGNSAVVVGSERTVKTRGKGAGIVSDEILAEVAGEGVELEGAAGELRSCEVIRTPELEPGGGVCGSPVALEELVKMEQTAVAIPRRKIETAGERVRSKGVKELRRLAELAGAMKGRLQVLVKRGGDGKVAARSREVDSAAGEGGDARAEIARLRRELEKSQAQVMAVQKQLARTNQKLYHLQGRIKK